MEGKTSLRDLNTPVGFRPSNKEEEEERLDATSPPSLEWQKEGRSPLLLLHTSEVFASMMARRGTWEKEEEEEQVVQKVAEAQRTDGRSPQLISPSPSLSFVSS